MSNEHKSVRKPGHKLLYTLQSQGQDAFPTLGCSRTSFIDYRGLYTFIPSKCYFPSICPNIFESCNCICFDGFLWQFVPRYGLPLSEKVAAEVPLNSSNIPDFITLCKMKFTHTSVLKDQPLILLLVMTFYQCLRGL